MRCVIVALAALGLLLAAPASAWAAEGGDKGGMDIFKGALDLTIWTIAVFLILFFILRAYAWGPIKEGLDRREQSIAHDKLEAVKAKQEADALRVKLDAELARANDQVRQMMDKARADAQALATEEINRGKTELQAERERLYRDVSMTKDQALQEIWTKAAELATLISAKAVKKQLSEQDHRALLDEALNEFQAAARSRVTDITSARA
jgi:F-type H+-transporting ATPase subunit b